MGSQGEDVGLQITEPGGNAGLSRACLHHGRQEQVACDRYRGPLYQHCRSRWCSGQILQDHTVTTKVPDPSGVMLQGRQWVRRGQH